MTTTEPLPADSPLWTTDGIVVLPHVGGLAAGEPLREVVDPHRGY